MADLSNLGQQQLSPGITSLSAALGDPDAVAEYPDWPSRLDASPIMDWPPSATAISPASIDPPAFLQMAGMTIPRPGMPWIPPGTFDEWQKNADKGMQGLWNYFRRGFPDVGGSRKDDRCEEEWNKAYEKCADEMGGPNRGITGGYSNFQDCVRGLVSKECGGNALDWGKKGER